jgi:DNA-binding transcriptional regulator YiaG
VADALRIALGGLPGQPRQGVHEGSAAAAHAIEGVEIAVRRGVELAREAFASHVEVPEAMVRREDEMVRLGRMDARVLTALAAPRQA